MDGRIDWLSWTMRPSDQPENISHLYTTARKAVKSLSDEHEDWLFNGEPYDRTSRRSTFNLCLSRDDNGVLIGGQSPTGYLLFEATGRACNAINEPATSRRIVSEIAGLLTRLDYACDIETETLPSEFVNARSHRAFRSLSFIRSDTGETAYVGSAKSDRFCRVYRYNPPHPRSHLLRIEFVFRRALARSVAEQYVSQESDAHFAARLGQTWGFSHRDWQPGEQTDERIIVPSVKKHDEDTIAWLYKQVLPAMRRVVATGGFDMADFLERVYNQ